MKRIIGLLVLVVGLAGCQGAPWCGDPIQPETHVDPICAFTYPEGC